MGPALLALLLAGQGAPPPIIVARDKPKLICRESEEELGSHIRTGARCKTDEEWRLEDEERGRIPRSMRVTPAQGDALSKQSPP
jgi:hypothetical protein